MKVPLTWLKDFVDIDLPIEELAHRLTMAGLEVEEIRYVGLPMPVGGVEGRAGGQQRVETKVTGLAWDPEKIVVGAILEVMPHPNADRLVLCRLDDGEIEHSVLTGAPNLFPYKGQGPLEKPIKVAYAKEGAQIFDGHKQGPHVMTLKRATIRGVESYSMACSEKELGISDEHEGIIFLDDDAPTGMPLVDYMGDAVLDIAITPNIARDANVLGVAREVAALTGQELRPPSLDFLAEGPSIEGQVSIEIQNPELNPRFVFALVQNVKIGPSPYWFQRRLRLAGMRPINNIVDTTNYVMLELGEPLHAFDYDVLVGRASEGAPKIITRTARQGERLTTLDDVDRTLDDFTVLVTDTAGPLAIAGVMGGAESEVSEGTLNVLLEGAAWNYINVRRTLTAQNLQSEAAYRFSRGVHPALAERGVRRGIELMRRLAGGTIAKGLIDNYPLPPTDPTVEITTADAKRWLGLDLSAEQMADILQRLEFSVEVEGQTVRATTPDHRLDIGTGVVGMADLMEEIARIYGYDNIPETRMADELPPQQSNQLLEREEQLRDLLINLGLTEVISYRLTSPDQEARRLPPDSPADDRRYIRLLNPISSERLVMRHSLLASMLEIVERNARFRQRIAIFEIGKVFLASEESPLPDEPDRLGLILTGPLELPSWHDGSGSRPMDFYDLKGLLQAMFAGLHLNDAIYAPSEHPSFHPGKQAKLLLRGSQGKRQVGVLGELHPLVKERYDLPPTPLVAAILDLDTLLHEIPDHFKVEPVAAFPPVLEDLAIVVDEALAASQVGDLIREAGGRTLVSAELFDVYRGDQVGPGRKSLAYSLAFQAPDRTLTDQEVAKIRNKIIRRLETHLNARLRS